MWERGLKRNAFTGLVKRKAVAPRVGAWIETACLIPPIQKGMSLPVWERGLKLALDASAHLECRVAPRVGAWIETSNLYFSPSQSKVAPRVGAWIETE